MLQSRLPPFVRCFLLPRLFLLLAGLTGCGKLWAPTPSTATPALTGATTLTGTVNDSAGAPIAGAVVSVAQVNLQATTDATGRYSLALPKPTPTQTAYGISVSSDLHAPVGKRLPVNQAVQDFILRPFDSVTTVVLPSAGQPSVSATAAHGDGSVTLTLPSDSLVTPSGMAATGNATVRLTYWNPSTDVATRPGSLAAALPGNANVMLGLQSLGMVDVQIVQGNDTLQVAQGKHLNLDQVLPGNFQRAMQQRPSGMHDPFLFYFDTAAAQWVVDGKLSYDATKGALMGELPHLTTWNFDAFQNWNPPASCTTDDIINNRANCGKPSDATLGGCVAGKALQKDGTVLANGTVRMWLFDFEHISAIDVPTDATGRYCVDVGTRLCVPSGNNPICTYHTNTINYHVSAPGSPDESNWPNPIPQSCRNQAGAYGSANYAGTMQYYNDCGLVDDDSTSQTGGTKPLVAPHQADISVCSYCDGKGPGSCGVSGVALSQSCTVLPDLVGQGPACKVFLKLGEACSLETGACCLENTICRDQICVPLSDPKPTR
jgi:hypothetical protein